MYPSAVGRLVQRQVSDEACGFKASFKVAQTHNVRRSSDQCLQAISRPPSPRERRGFEPLQRETKSLGHRRKIYQRHGIFRRNFREPRNNARKCFRSSIASFVKKPCLSAFLFSLGAPDPGAPPCIRQRFLPCTAGDLQEPPFRVLAPQRWLANIGTVLRG